VRFAFSRRSWVPRRKLTDLSWIMGVS